ncbi:protein SSUH2 homolog [Ambystoma mexicanum]|uniref:protein SSUH2 homolog n=1 Tax=Ambystoma mexicanum TaxID=8296 RepID=UPI0037E822CE
MEDRSAAAYPVNGPESHPLLAPAFPGHPGAPGQFASGQVTYPAPVGGAPGPYPPIGMGGPPMVGAATAPTLNLMFDPVPGYEGLAVGAGDGRWLPPPPAPAPPIDVPPPNVEWSISSISEDTAKQAFIQYANSKCCYSSAPANDMLLKDLQPFNTYRYRLETFTEARTTGWKNVPYNGEPVDSMGGPAPLPWDIAVPVPEMFKDGEEHVKVPHTSSVKACEKCLGLGQTICKECQGSGRLQCTVCKGTGKNVDDQCSHCNGIGNQSCSKCKGQGRIDCATCEGKKNLLCYIELKATWKNNIHEFLADQSSGFPAENFKKVTGKKLFTDEQFMVYPVMTFPDASINHASQAAVEKHRSEFASSCRILRQRHTVELIPLTKVNYSWKGNPNSYFVYGVENKVFTENYPATCCCCSVM